jgi:hypothetical protein
MKAKIGLYLQWRTPEGKQSNRCPAVFDKKSRLKAGWCLVKGVEEFHPNAKYYLRFPLQFGRQIVFRVAVARNRLLPRPTGATRS